MVVDHLPKDLYSLGDIHGDYDRLVQVLAVGRLIAAKPSEPGAVQWTGGGATLVITGDMIDKYTQNLPVIALLRALGPRAEQAGGRLIITLGNHEAEFLASGGADKKAVDFHDELTSAGISPAEVARGADAGGIGQWLRNLPVGAKVGGWFFCHAGNTEGRTLAQLADEATKQITEHDFDIPILIGPNSILEARMTPRPWWDWDGSEPMLKDVAAPVGAPKPSKKSAATSKMEISPGQDPGRGRLEKELQELGVGHLVIGHQPQQIKFPDGSVREAGRIFTEFDGLVYLTDTGMSRGVAGGRGGLLHIYGDPAPPTVEAVYMDGKIEPVAH